MANLGVTFDFRAESAKLRTEIDKVRKELSGINATAKGIGDGFKTMGAAIAGAFSVGAVVGFLQKVNAAADALNDLSGRLNASASGLQVIQLAAETAGGSAEAAAAGLAKMSETLGNAVAGQKTAVAAFDRLNLSARELANLKADEAFKRIAGALGAIPNVYERASAAQDIFGKGAKDLAGLFAGGSTAIEETNKALERQGALLSDLDVAKIGAMNDDLAVQRTIVDNLGAKFLSGLTPAIEAAVGAVGEMTGSIGGARQAGQSFGVALVAAVKIAQAGIYGVAAAFEGVRSIVAGLLYLIAAGFEKVLGVMAAAADALGLGIADKLASARETVGGVARSLDEISRSAQANAKTAATAAIQAVLDVAKAGVILDQYARELEARSAAAAAQAQSGQGAIQGTLNGAPAGGTNPKDPAVKVSQASLGPPPDPFQSPLVIEQSAIADALLTVQEQYAQTAAGRWEALEQTKIGMLLTSHQWQIQAEQSKNLLLGDMMGGLAQQAMQHGGAIGKAGKALAIAQTIWATASAVVQSYNNAGGYPWGIAPAAAMLATGLMQLANIKKTNVGSGGNVAPAKASGSTSASVGGMGDTTPASQPSQENAQRSAVQIFIEGNLISGPETADWLVSQLADAVNNRDVVFINSNSRQAIEMAGAGA